MQKEGCGSRHPAVNDGKGHRQILTILDTVRVCSVFARGRFCGIMPQHGV